MRLAAAILLLGAAAQAQNLAPGNVQMSAALTSYDALSLTCVATGSSICTRTFTSYWPGWMTPSQIANLPIVAWYHGGGLHTGSNQSSAISPVAINGVVSMTYTSGGTITGTAGQTCLWTATNGTLTAPSVAASGTFVLTASISGSPVASQIAPASLITPGGHYAVSAPTQVTLSNGTASCSGTGVVVSATLGPVCAASAALITSIGCDLVARGAAFYSVNYTLTNQKIYNIDNTKRTYPDLAVDASVNTRVSSASYCFDATPHTGDVNTTLFITNGGGAWKWGTYLITAVNQGGCTPGVAGGGGGNYATLNASPAATNSTGATFGLVGAGSHWPQMGLDTLSFLRALAINAGPAAIANGNTGTWPGNPYQITLFGHSYGNDAYFAAAFVDPDNPFWYGTPGTAASGTWTSNTAAAGRNYTVTDIVAGSPIVDTARRNGGGPGDAPSSTGCYIASDANVAAGHNAVTSPFSYAADPGYYMAYSYPGNCQKIASTIGPQEELGLYQYTKGVYTTVPTGGAAAQTPRSPRVHLFYGSADAVQYDQGTGWTNGVTYSSTLIDQELINACSTGGVTSCTARMYAGYPHDGDMFVTSPCNGDSNPHAQPPSVTLSVSGGAVSSISCDACGYMDSWATTPPTLSLSNGCTASISPVMSGSALVGITLNNGGAGCAGTNKLVAVPTPGCGTKGRQYVDMLNFLIPPGAKTR